MFVCVYGGGGGGGGVVCVFGGGGILEGSFFNSFFKYCPVKNVKNVCS